MKNKIKYIKAWKRDKIVIMKKKVPIKLQRGHQLKKKKKKKRKKYRKADKGRELQILEKTNNAPVAISLESTVGSCLYLDMLFSLHTSTNWPERLEGTQYVWQKSSSGMSWKTKRKCTCRAVWSPTDFSLNHRWIMLILVYVVRLDVTFILDGGDRKIFCWQGFVHVEQ